jgi:hypothetical protein
MKCRYVENNLIGYIEKTLPPQVLTEIDNHLENCAGCNALVRNIKDTYTIFDGETIKYPNLYGAINARMSHKHSSVINFIPNHRIIYRMAASVIVIIGMSIGVFIGSKYSSSVTTSTSNTSALTQSDEKDYYTSEHPMDSEAGLAQFYSNEN